MQRDENTLCLLANLTKNLTDSSDDVAIKQVGTSKGSNYVFASISRSVENDLIKRKFDENDKLNDENIKKRMKISKDNQKIPKKSLLDHLN